MDILITIHFLHSEPCTKKEISNQYISLHKYTLHSPPYLTWNFICKEGKVTWLRDRDMYKCPRKRRKSFEHWPLASTVLVKRMLPQLSLLRQWWNLEAFCHSCWLWCSCFQVSQNLYCSFFFLESFALGIHIHIYSNICSLGGKKPIIHIHTHACFHRKSLSQWVPY